MAGPELDDGYTRISNKILEEVAKRRFNGTQFRILMIVWRYTYGFNRKSHELSVTFLAEAIQSDQRGVKAELNKLLDMKVLKVTQVAHGARPRKIGFNKYCNQWLEGAISPPKKSKVRGEQLAPASVGNSPPLLVGDSSPKKERKKNIKKEEIYMETPPGKIKFLDTVFLTQEQYDKLCEDFGKAKVDLYIEMVDEWQTNNPKKQKKDHNKTIRVWIKKDEAKGVSSKQQRNKEQMDLLKQFGQGGEPHESKGDLQLTRGH